jgi:hypothetical protein
MKKFVDYLASFDISASSTTLHSTGSWPDKLVKEAAA